MQHQANNNGRIVDQNQNPKDVLQRAMEQSPSQGIFSGPSMNRNRSIHSVDFQTIQQKPAQRYGSQQRREMSGSRAILEQARNSVNYESSTANRKFKRERTSSLQGAGRNVLG